MVNNDFTSMQNKYEGGKRYRKEKEMNIKRFKRFSNDKYKLEMRVNSMKDNRESFIISASTIFLVLFYGLGILRKGSLLGVDQFVRMETGKELFEKEKAVVSDTTISRSIEGYDIDRLRELGSSLYLTGRSSGEYKYETGSGKKLKVGIIDGSKFGSVMASCFQQLGKVSIMLDLERIPKLGKELESSESLLLRLTNRYGRKFVDLLLLDGLYFAPCFINKSLKDCGIDVLIKMKEEANKRNKLNIIEDAKELFKNYDKFKGDIEYKEGFDKERMCSYKVWACEGLTFEGVEKTFKVAYVEEEYPKRKEDKEERFSVATTMEELSALDMRELGHERWGVEITDGFKELNEQCNTKHIFSHDPHAQIVVLLILFIAYNLFQLFNSTIDYEKDIRPVFGGVKLTKRFFSDIIYESISYG
jgi:hypothetical protein